MQMVTVCAQRLLLDFRDVCNCRADLGPKLWTHSIFASLTFLSSFKVRFNVCPAREGGEIVTKSCSNDILTLLLDTSSSGQWSRLPELLEPCLAYPGGRDLCKEGCSGAHRQGKDFFKLLEEGFFPFLFHFYR